MPLSFRELIALSAISGKFILQKCCAMNRDPVGERTAAFLVPFNVALGRPLLKM